MPATQRDPVRTIVPAVGLLLVLGLAVVLGLASTASPPATDQPPVDAGATAWMLTSTALVLLMVPGLAMFYGGLVRTKNVLGTMMHSFAAMAIIGVIWVVFGYAMAFGPNVLGGWFGWDPGLLFLQSIDSTVGSNGVPDFVFAMFQGKFAIITPALIAGAFAERVRFRGYFVFIALWSLLVYNPLCHWVWAADGFLFQLGAIDFAGGTVVHISAGISGLIAVLYLGSRRGYPQTAMHPNNLVMTLMGVGLLWVGWFGFNAGSSLDQRRQDGPGADRDPGRRGRRRPGLDLHRGRPASQGHRPGHRLGHPGGPGGDHARGRRRPARRCHRPGLRRLVPVLQRHPAQEPPGLRRHAGRVRHPRRRRHHRRPAADVLHPRRGHARGP